MSDADAEKCCSLRVRDATMQAVSVAPESFESEWPPSDYATETARSKWHTFPCTVAPSSQVPPQCPSNGRGVAKRAAI